MQSEKALLFLDLSLLWQGPFDLPVKLSGGESGSKKVRATQMGMHTSSGPSPL